MWRMETIVMLEEQVYGNVAKMWRSNIDDQHAHNAVEDVGNKRVVGHERRRDERVVKKMQQLW